MRQLIIISICLICSLNIVYATNPADSIKAKIENYSKLIAIDPNDNYSLFERGVLYFKTGKNKLAQKDFQKIDNYTLEYNLSHSYLADIYYADNKIDLAIEHYNLFIEAFEQGFDYEDQKIRAYHNLGKCLILKNNYIDAIYYFNKACLIGVNNNLGDLYYSRAYAWLNLIVCPEITYYSWINEAERADNELYAYDDLLSAKAYGNKYADKQLELLEKKITSSFLRKSIFEKELLIKEKEIPFDFWARNENTENTIMINKIIYVFNRAINEYENNEYDKSNESFKEVQELIFKTEFWNSAFSEQVRSLEIKADYLRDLIAFLTNKYEKKNKPRLELLTNSYDKISDSNDVSSYLGLYLKSYYLIKKNNYIDATMILDNIKANMEFSDNNIFKGNRNDILSQVYLMLGYSRLKEEQQNIKLGFTDSKVISKDISNEIIGILQKSLALGNKTADAFISETILSSYNFENQIDSLFPHSKIIPEDSLSIRRKAEIKWHLYRHGI